MKVGPYHMIAIWTFLKVLKEVAIQIIFFLQKFNSWYVESDKKIKKKLTIVIWICEFSLKQHFFLTFQSLL